MSESAPGFAKHPQHQIDIEPIQQTARVTFAGEVIATTTDALRLCESRYPPVIYIPFADCQQALFVPSDTETYCPFKGTASYWTLQLTNPADADSDKATDAVWGYKDPYSEVLPIKNLVAFYLSKFDIEITLS